MAHNKGNPRYGGLSRQPTLPILRHHAATAATPSMTTTRAPRKPATLRLPTFLLHTVWLLLLCIDPARAQGAGCEQFKETLAGRIRVSGFSLETVPASTKTPAGAKVVGTCEGGAYKILLVRGGGAGLQQAADTAASAPEAVAPSPTPAAAKAAAAATATPTPTATPVPTRAPTPTATPAPTATPTPVPTPAATPQPTPAVSSTTAAAAPASATEAATTEVTHPEDMPWTERASEFLSRHWPWVLSLAGLPLLIWLAAWITRRRYYDEAGLPRGPRLN